MSTAYAEFLERKTQLGGDYGFEPENLPEWLFPFQRDLVTWALRKGRAAIFADCGLGKTPMQLVWADNVAKHSKGRVLLISPLAVSHQTIREGEKFGLEVGRSDDGEPKGALTITNYERLHMFEPTDYAGVVCDESSAIKSFNGVRRELVTKFMLKHKYRLLCTATAAPNDFIELGISAQALGGMDRTEVLNRFFKNDDGTSLHAREKWIGQNPGRKQIGWRFKGHAEEPFWRWVAGWARALRAPSDMGYSDDGFILPPMEEREHLVKARTLAPGRLFELAAFGMYEVREEQRRTIEERCEKVAELVNSTGQPAVVWCHYNDEGDLLEKLIPGCVQVAGADSDEKKERSFIDFSDGNVRVLVTKPKIGAFGLNWQHCAHMTFFPSYSYEQFYQAVRRCWRYGQTRPVIVDVVTTEGGSDIMHSLDRKADQASRMFTSLVLHMNHAISVDAGRYFTQEERLPSWL